MTFKPVPRTLYLTGSSDPEWMICLPDGRCWDLYEGMDMPRAVGWDWHPDCTAARVEIARDLSDAEIASLAASDTRPGAVAAILASRAKAARRPRSDEAEAEAEVERWRKAAERAEADRQEWQALALNHEGAIERLTRDLAEARETRDRALYAERAAGSRADAAEAEVERLRQVIVGLAAKIAGVRWLTAENPDPR